MDNKKGGQVVRFTNKNKIIYDLYLYLTGNESISGLSSNFTTCVQVLEGSAYATEANWCSKIHHTIANDGVFHERMAGKLDNITKLKSARRVLKSCSPNLQERLLLTFYESPGKISACVREYMQYEHSKIHIDVSALSLLVGNLSIAELETLARDNKRKNDFHALIKRTKDLCNKTLLEYIEEHGKCHE